MITPSDRTLVDHFAGSAPRYTSYPTAPHFHPGVTPKTVADWAARLDQDASISLYVHIPYCGTLCWFCACRSQGVRVYGPVSRYLDGVLREIDATAPRFAGKRVRHVHWGGGSPTILAAEDIERLAAALRGSFDIDADAEIAVEIDPRDMSDARLDAVAAIGATRASLGVQDFDETVQKAINRRQSREDTARVIEGLRRRGVANVNIDALYGLPHQTRERLGRTLDQVAELAPNRVALFGYAHVPWMAKRQKLIEDDALAGPHERFEMARIGAERLNAAGYETVGLDHFAKPEDALAAAAREGRLRRNFQGYTTDVADALVGIGASAISRYPSGFAQNEASTAGYLSAIADAGLATARGVAFSMDDRVRGHAIERLMCDLAFDADALRSRFGDFAEAAIADANRALDALPEGVIEREGDGFRVTARGRPFVRSIASAFDAYAEAGAAKFSRAV